MSEIAALQAADRARPVPPGLRAQAYSMFMELPDEVEALPASEEPASLPPALRTGAFATLMQAPRRRSRPMILRLVAASLAVALPAAALVVAAQLRGPHRPQGPLALGPVVVERLADPGDSLFRGLPEMPSRVQQPVAPKPPVKVLPRRVVRAPAKALGVRTSRPRKPAPPPPQRDLVTTVLDQVQQITDLACEITSTVLPVCGAEQKSLPILGSSG